MSHPRSALISDGPHYGVSELNRGFVPSSRRVVAWFCHLPDAQAFAAEHGLSVWDMWKGKMVRQ